MRWLAANTLFGGAFGKWRWRQRELSSRCSSHPVRRAGLRIAYATLSFGGLASRNSMGNELTQFTADPLYRSAIVYLTAFSHNFCKCQFSLVLVYELVLGRMGHTRLERHMGVLITF